MIGIATIDLCAAQQRVEPNFGRRIGDDDRIEDEQIDQDAVKFDWWPDVVRVHQEMMKGWSYRQAIRIAAIESHCSTIVTANQLQHRLIDCKIHRVWLMW